MTWSRNIFCFRAPRYWGTIVCFPNGSCTQSVFLLGCRSSQQHRFYFWHLYSPIHDTSRLFISVRKQLVNQKPLPSKKQAKQMEARGWTAANRPDAERLRCDVQCACACLPSFAAYLPDGECARMPCYVHLCVTLGKKARLHLMFSLAKAETNPLPSLLDVCLKGSWNS